jgi:hypothetical protein
LVTSKVAGKAKWKTAVEPAGTSRRLVLLEEHPTDATIAVRSSTATGFRRLLIVSPCGLGLEGIGVSSG